MTQGSFDWPATGADAFWAYHAENPEILDQLVGLAHQAQAAGRTHFGMKMLFEVLRWYTMVEAKNDSFKLNNNWHAWYVRLIERDYPELRGFFEKRTSRADKEVSRG
jgi:hypothetical protein